MITLELSDREGAAMLLLLKLGMDVYEETDASAEVLELLRNIPNSVLDGLLAKVSRAGTEQARGQH